MPTTEEARKDIELNRIEGDGSKEDTSKEDDSEEDEENAMQGNSNKVWLPGIRSYDDAQTSAPETSDSYRSRWQMLSNHIQSVQADLLDKMLNVGQGDEGKKVSASKQKLSDIVLQYQAKVKADHEEAASSEQRIAHDGDHEISKGDSGKRGTIPLSEWHRIIEKLKKDTP